jgi:hypothetical protein
MMFYNGFNLLIDLIVGGTVYFFTHRTAWLDGYQTGIADVAEGHVYLDKEIREKLANMGDK